MCRGHTVEAPDALLAAARCRPLLLPLLLVIWAPFCHHRRDLYIHLNTSSPGSLGHQQCPSLLLGESLSNVFVYGTEAACVGTVFENPMGCMGCIMGCVNQRNILVTLFILNIHHWFAKQICCMWS